MKKNRGLPGRWNYRSFIPGWIIIFSLLNSVLSVILTFFLLSVDIPLKDDIFLVRVTSTIKRMLSDPQKHIPTNRFLFLNVSYDNSLTEKYDEDGFVIGNIPIVDRLKLTSFLQRINSDSAPRPQYILCDIFFSDSSSSDSVFYAELMRTRSIIIPYHFSNDYDVLRPIFKINSGFADYPRVENAFYKFHLFFNDSTKSLPLKMFEDIHHSRVQGGGLMFSLDNNWLLGSVIIDFSISNPTGISDRSNKSPLMNLNDLLSLPDSVFHALTRDRIIIMGDFYEHDLHRTSIGLLPGSIILLNTFLTIEQGRAFVPSFFILFLFVCYFTLSYFVFSRKKIAEQKVFDRIRASKYGVFFIKLFEYVFILIFISLISYYLFNIHLNILILGVYFKAIEAIVNYIYNKFSVPKEHL